MTNEEKFLVLWAERDKLRNSLGDLYRAAYRFEEGATASANIRSVMNEESGLLVGDGPDCVVSEARQYAFKDLASRANSACSRYREVHRELNALSRAIALEATEAAA